MDQIHHFLDPHPLILIVEDRSNKVYCSGCGECLPDPIYGCSDCEFYLHKSCAELPQEIQKNFHPCPLLLNILYFGHRCDDCLERIPGFSYRCERCDFDMHIKCAQQPTIGEKLIRHFTHQHPLKLVDKTKELEAPCVICDKLCSAGGSSSSAYGCEECNFFLHNSCMINIPEQINHFFHPSCPLTPLTTSSDWCQGCDEHGSGLVFRCGKCRFQLDVKCALLPTIESKGADKIQHSSHQHPLALRESWNLALLKFGAEHVEKTAHHQVPVLFVKDATSSYTGHVLLSFHKKSIIPFILYTLSLSRPSHRILFIKLFDVWHASDSMTDEEFYCDVCEEKRFKFEEVYYCEECKFIAEVRCVMSELWPSLAISEDQSSIDGRVISRDEENSALETTIGELKNEITELKTEEGPLEVEIEKLQTRLEKIKRRLRELETDHFLYNYQLNHYKKQNNYPTEASTSKGQSLSQP
ncbi:hypothetical protein PTKIN_Ptkin04bG0213500 [Pterospermum kingtungense]